MSVARSGENLARKAPPGPATTCRAVTRLVASLTVIVTRSREAKPLPTTVRGARDRILKVGARRVGEAVATVATAAASTIGVVTLIHILASRYPGYSAFSIEGSVGWRRRRAASRDLISSRGETA